MTLSQNERSRKILEAIVEDYIASAEPVGSKSVTSRHQMGLSPATVRNVMADLEGMTVPEIAELVNANVNTVYSRLRAARKEFDHALARMHAGGGNSR